MAVILLNPDVVIFTDPMAAPGKAHPHRWWAERGLVHWENQTTGDYGSNTVYHTLLRLKGLQDMVSNSRSGNGIARGRDAIEKYQTYIDGMIGVCKKAREQGDPNNPNVTRQKAAEIKAARQSRHVVIPGLGSGF